MNYKLSVPVALVLVIFISGCASEEARKILINSFEKAKKIDSYTGNVDIKISLSGASLSSAEGALIKHIRDGKLVLLEGNIDVARKKGGNNTYRSRFGTANSFGVQIRGGLFVNKNGSYICIDDKGNLFCAEVELPQSSTRMIQEADFDKIVNLLDDLYKKGTLSISAENTQGLMAGRLFNKIKASIDIQKLTQDEKKIFNIGEGTKFQGKTVEDIFRQSKLDIEMGFDKETGALLLLYIKVTTFFNEEFVRQAKQTNPQSKLKAGDDMIVELHLSTNRFSIGARDSIFDLPETSTVVDIGEFQDLLIYKKAEAGEKAALGS